MSLRAAIAIVSVATVLAAGAIVAFIVVMSVLTRAVTDVPHAYASYWNSVDQMMQAAKDEGKP